MMNIFCITRRPWKKETARFPVGRSHILDRIELMGHRVTLCVVQPKNNQNPYLSYGLAVSAQILKFKRSKYDLVLAYNMESGIMALMIKYLFGIPFVFNFIWENNNLLQIRQTDIINPSCVKGVS
jgi:hypothetical protein